MTMFMPNTICPTARSVRLLTRIATASVPSRQPPSRMTMPTPRPSNTPPKQTARSVSPVALAQPLNSSTQPENTVIENAARTVNPRPSLTPPSTRKGTLRSTVRSASGIPVTCETIMPTPMTPPSRMVLGTRNSSTANAAMAEPSASRAKLKIGREGRRFMCEGLSTLGVCTRKSLPKASGAIGPRGRRARHPSESRMK